MLGESSLISRNTCIGYQNRQIQWHKELHTRGRYTTLAVSCLSSDNKDKGPESSLGRTSNPTVGISTPQFNEVINNDGKSGDFRTQASRIRHKRTPVIIRCSTVSILMHQLTTTNIFDSLALRVLFIIQTQQVMLFGKCKQLS